MLVQNTIITKVGIITNSTNNPKITIKFNEETKYKLDKLTNNFYYGECNFHNNNDKLFIQTNITPNCYNAIRFRLEENYDNHPYSQYMLPNNENVSIIQLDNNISIILFFLPIGG